jgi:hypothetical protein
MKFDCSRPTCFSQSANRSLPSFCAFENLARDVPASLMSIIAVRQELTGPFERNFYIGYHSRAKAVRDHDNPSVSDGRIISAKGKTERWKTKHPPGVSRRAAIGFYSNHAAECRSNSASWIE